MIMTLGANMMKSFEEFKNALGQRESGNNYKSQNKYGYTGRYQFGAARLKDLGYKGTMTAFKNNPAIQEEYFIKHVQDHAKYLFPVLADAKKKRGDYITLSGLIAGAHLGGRGGVAKFIAGTDFADANGTKVSSYVKQFSGYEIPGYNESTGTIQPNKIFNSGSGINTAGIDTNKLLIAIAAAAGLTIFINLFQKY